VKILNRFSDVVIFEDENENVSDTLRNAYLSNADLSNADLSGADLSNADLSNAYLRNADLSNADLSNAYLRNANLSNADLSGADLMEEILTKTPISVLNLTWPVLITEKYMTIGCQRHTIEMWVNFTDDKIDLMHPEAVKFWRKWKAPLLTIWEAYCKNYEEKE